MAGPQFRRDVSTTNIPSKDQIEIGEIVINAVTGRLYTVTVNPPTVAGGSPTKGEVIEFVGSLVCQQTTTVPDIIFSDTTGFCCLGDTLGVEVSGLQENTNYTFSMSELTENSSSIGLASANYTNYTGSVNGDDINYLKSAIIPVSINTTDNKSAVSIFEFNVLSENDLITSKVLSVKCKDCSASTTADPGSGSDTDTDTGVQAIIGSNTISSPAPATPPPPPVSSPPPPVSPPSPPSSYGY
jgi:hypothetical protein